MSYQDILLVSVILLILDAIFITLIYSTFAKYDTEYTEISNENKISSNSICVYNHGIVSIYTSTKR